MRNRTFEEGLEFGRRGERLVERHLQARGLATMPAYDFAGQGAPSMRRGSWRAAVPDILGMKAGSSFWFEVKTYTTSPLNRERQCRVHGVTERLWRGYEQIAVGSGTPVYLLVLELDTCELRSVSVGRVETWGCSCRACDAGYPGQCQAVGRRLVYFDRAQMTRIHTFTRAECDAVRDGDGREAA